MASQTSITLPCTRKRLIPIETPDFLHLLTTNAPPNPQNASVICQALSAASEDLAAIELELPQLAAALEAIQARHAHLTSYVKRYRPAVSPVRRLPPEILSRIFLFCRPDGITNMLDTTKYPWTLTQVCRGWRSAATSTPRLWSNITPEPMPKSASRAKSIVEMFIDRSKNTSLSVRITSTCIEIPFRSSIDCILSTASRWADLTLSVKLSSRIPLVLRQLRGNLQSLQQLIIEGQGPMASYDYDTARDIFWVAPMLKRVIFRDVPLTHFLIPWNQITHLDYKYKSLSGSAEEVPEEYTLDVLRNVPLLEELRYHAVDFEVEGMGPITFPSLRALHISNSSTFTQLITAPCLQTLHLSFDLNGEHPPDPDINALSNMLSQSRPPLQTLSIDTQNSMDCDEILPLLKHTPTLTHLDVDQVTVLERLFFDALTVNPANTPPLLPKLKTITISCAYHCPVSVIDKLLDFLESRCGDVKCTSLTKVRLPVSPTVLSLPSRAYRLKRLIDGGLDFASTVLG